MRLASAGVTAMAFRCMPEAAEGNERVDQLAPPSVLFQKAVELEA